MPVDAGLAQRSLQESGGFWPGAPSSMREVESKRVRDHSLKEHVKATGPVNERLQEL
jgi:hypothetical protein